MNPIVTAALTPLVGQLAPLLIAPLASMLAKGAEKVPAIPYEGKTRGGIIAALGLASFACTVGLTWASGNLDTVDWNHGATLLVTALEAMLAAAGGYALLWAKSKGGGGQALGVAANAHRRGVS